MTEIRDPLHGPIHLAASELPLVDSPAYQRLRGIKQLGFAEMTFPGSTHTRYLHSLGVMHLAGRVFDTVFAGADWLSGLERKRCRQAVRLAALLHDVGHPPLSHTAERLLPPVAELGLPEPYASSDRRAGHEDVSMALITSGALAAGIESGFGDLGVSPSMVAGILDPQFPVADGAYDVGGFDLRPVLGQIVSSECDVDRMDYLLRDSYFTGASYGRFDLDWLIGGLTHHVADGVVNLALDARAILSFEDFLLSRYHMFVMVYFHHRTNAYDRMLLHFLEALDPPFRFPADLDRYCEYDDAHLQAVLRQHRDHPWARRILSRKPLPLIVDLQGDEARQARGPLEEALAGEGIEPYWIESTGILSKYYGRSDDPYRRIYVVGHRTGGGRRVTPLEEATDLFSRYNEPRYLLRLHVTEDDKRAARRLAAEILPDILP